MAKITDFIFNQFKNNYIRTCLITAGIVGGGIATLILFAVFPPLGIAGLSIAGIGIGSATAITAINFALTPLMATMGGGLLSLLGSFIAKKLSNKVVPAINDYSDKNNKEKITVDYKYLSPNDLTRTLVSNVEVDVRDDEAISVSHVKFAIAKKHNTNVKNISFFRLAEQINSDNDDEVVNPKENNYVVIK